MHLLYATLRKIKARPELAILVVAGFFLRIKGTSPGYFAHGDELMYGEAVFMILNKTLGMEPQVLGYYPPLVAWIMLGAFIFIYIPATVITQLPQLGLNLIDYGALFADQNALHFFKSNILGPNWANAVYWGRYTTVIFGTASIILTYYIALKLFNTRLVAFLASLFIAVNYRLVLNSKIGFPDIYNVFFVLATFLLILSLYEKPSTKKYLFSWIVIGLSFLIKYQTYTIPVFLIVHFLISLKRSGNKIKLLLPSLFNKGFIAGGVITLLMVLISHYYHFQNWEKVRGMYEYQALKYGLGINNLNIYPISYVYHIMLGPILVVTGISGLFLGIIRKKYRAKTLILSSILAPTCFLYFYYSTGGTYTRNLLVILPILIIYSAFFFSSLWYRLSKGLTNSFFRIVSLTAVAIIIISAALGQATNAIIASDKLSEISPRILVEKWLTDNLPPDSVIGTYFGSFSLNDNLFLLKSFSGVAEALSFKELEAENVDYALVDFSMVTGPLIWWMGQPTDIGIKFWNKPDNLLSQSYNALAIRELLWSHTIQAYLPKWQIPGYDYAIISLQSKNQNIDYSPIKTYSFDSGDEDWTKLTYFEETRNLLNVSSKSLAINQEIVQKTDGIKRILARPGMVRWESPTMDAKHSYAYKVEGHVRAQESTNKQNRNGFIRLDFYAADIDHSIESRPMMSFVSERYWGSGDWKKLEIEGIAPEGAGYLRIGFQTDQAQSNYFVDNIVLYQSDYPIDNKQMKHIIIDDNDLFPPNDGGFL